MRFLLLIALVAAAAAAASPTCPAGWTLMGDTNLLKPGDMKSVKTGNDTAACCSACKAAPPCIAWTLIEAEGRCYLKSGDGGSEATKGFISGRLDPCPGLLFSTNLLKPGDMSSVHTGNSTAKCCSACQQTKGCTAWTLIQAKGQCYLKSGDGGTEHLEGCVSGRMAPTPAPPPTPAPVPTGCEYAPQSAFPFCNASLPVQARVADLMSRMTTEEKLQFLQSRNPAIARLGIPSYDWDTEVLHGIFSSHNNFPASTIPRPTIFPNGIGLAASFDLDLVERCARVVGQEQRALNNKVMATNRPNSSLGESGQYQGMNGYAPNCNLYRDGRWVRVLCSSPLYTGPRV